jgi:hypothetical protein
LCSCGTEFLRYRFAAHSLYDNTMTDPSDLLRRASELTEQADHEENIDIRERLLRMAQYYIHIAESEEWPPRIRRR